MMFPAARGFALSILLTSSATLVSSTPAQGEAHGALEPVPFTEVTLEGGFWGPWQQVNREKILPHNLEACESTGRLRNFAQAAGRDNSPFKGHYFHDSDVAKVLEGAAYVLAAGRDAALEKRIEAIIDDICAAQQPDGYMNTWFILQAPDQRWTDIRAKHELYCAGHLFEAAVAWYEATGKRKFLDFACRFADHIDSVFGPDKRHVVPGHEEIELALIRLWRASGEDRYLRLARFFVDEHGKADTHQLFGTYCQDHAPLSEQNEGVGHCVRATYLYSAVADIAAITGEKSYVQALDRLWDNVVGRKMYITGGIGVVGHGEGFARDYILPNDKAYAETCAAIGMALWNQRMFLLHGDARFADVVERALYNGLLSGVALDGKTFFYVNPLSSGGDHHRQSWYGCSCCPTNIVRFLPALGGYLYATSSSEDSVHVVHYASGKGVVPMKRGNVHLVQETRYPWEGKVRISVDPRPSAEFGIQLRIPGWARGEAVPGNLYRFADAVTGAVEIRVNGKVVQPSVEKGFARIHRSWERGDVIDMELPMPVRRVASHPSLESNRGHLAIQRGPIVYCLEGIDHDGSVRRLALSKDAKLEARFQPDLLGGVTTLHGRGTVAAVAEGEDGSLITKDRDVEVKAVPYFSWDNRDAGEMVVWLPTETPSGAKMRGATVAILATPSASHCWEADTVRALNDNVQPEKSDDHDIPRFTWWGHRGTKEWVAYEWDRPRKLTATEVYWFDDSGRGGCRVPASWRLLWHDGEAWKPVEVEPGAACGVEKDRFNKVTFKPITTGALRLEVELEEGFSGGILEWRLPR